MCTNRHTHTHCHTPSVPSLGQSGCFSCSWEASILSFSCRLTGRGGTVTTLEPAFPEPDLLSREPREPDRAKEVQMTELEGLDPLTGPLKQGTTTPPHPHPCTQGHGLVPKTHSSGVPRSFLLPQMMAGLGGVPFYGWGDRPKCLALNPFIQSSLRIGSPPDLGL